MTAFAPNPSEFDEIITAYSPHPETVEPSVWEEVVDFVRSAVRDSQPLSTATLNRRLTAASQLVQFAVKHGSSLNRELVFHPDVVDRFLISLGERHLSQATARTYATELRAMGEAITVAAPWRPTVRHGRTATQPPYTGDELSRFVGLARRQRTDQRQRESLMLVGLVGGVGLERNEIRGFSAGQIDTRMWVVNIVGDRSRTVAIERDLIVPVAEVVAEDPGFCFAADRNVVNRMTARFNNDPLLPTLTVTRLRNTWLSRQLTHLTYGELLDASGYSTSRVLDDLYRMVGGGGQAHAE